MDYLSAMRVFVRSVDLGSFSSGNFQPMLVPIAALIAVPAPFS
jgi:hypothetical protein